MKYSTIGKYSGKAASCLAVFAMSLAGLASPALADDSWDHIEGSGRYVMLPAFSNMAVLDQETGLVWEKAPSPGAFTWEQAQARCNTLVIAKRMGWRLPTLQELTSLLDLGAPPANLSAGYPFAVLPPWNVGEHIWSATSSAAVPTAAWTMWLAGGVSSTDPKGSLSHAWCVRFRQGVDAQ